MTKSEETDEKTDEKKVEEKLMQCHLPVDVAERLTAHAKAEGFRTFASFQRAHWVKFAKGLESSG